MTPLTRELRVIINIQARVAVSYLLGEAVSVLQTLIYTKPCFYLAKKKKKGKYKERDPDMMSAFVDKQEDEV